MWPANSRAFPRELGNQGGTGFLALLHHNRVLQNTERMVGAKGGQDWEK
jgi:hypothetical protein